MPVRLRLSPSQASDLAVIANLDVHQFRQFINYVASLTEPIVSGKALYEIAAQRLDDRVARILVHNAISFAVLARQRDVTAHEIILAITDGLKSYGWSQDDLTKWDAVSAFFESLLASEALIVVAKAADLSFDYAHLLHGARIITDIRPVYDDKHTCFVGAVVSQILRVSYFGETGTNSLSIALDERDIRRLRQSCDEALKKMDVARQFLGSSGLQTVTTGEDADVFGTR